MVDESVLQLVERELGVRFPEDYRRLVLGGDRVKGFFPPAEDFLELFAVEDIAGINAAGELQARLPGAVAIGGNGSRELLVYDFREPVPPLLLLDIVAEDWSEAIPQAASLAEFLHVFPEQGWFWGAEDG
jgi:hypothetical protein